MFAPVGEFTILASIRDENLTDVRRQLEGHASPESSGEKLFILGQAGVHFARFAVVPDMVDGSSGALLFSVLTDDENYLLRFAKQIAATDETLFRYCTTFPENACVAEVRRWAEGNRIRVRTLYAGAVGETVQEIHATEKLRKSVSIELDSPAIDRRNSSVEIVNKLRETVRKNPNLPQRPFEGLSTRQCWRRRLHLIIFLLAIVLPFALLTVAVARMAGNATPTWTLIFAGTLGIPAISFLLWTVFFHYFCQPAQPEPYADKAKGYSIAREADTIAHGRQGQGRYTMVFNVRGGFMVRNSLRFFLWGAHFLTTHFWIRGQLAGVSSIHFARFYLIDEGRRMIFLSDFDGSSNHYIAEFIGVGKLAVVSIWSHLYGCPRSKFLFGIEPGFAMGFPPFVKEHLVQDAGYSAYPELSVQNICSNAEMRRLFFSEDSNQSEELLQSF